MPGTDIELASLLQAFEELCAAWRGLGGSIQEAPQQLLDLTELMQSYGMPTPGWDSKSPARGGTSPQQQVSCAAQASTTHSDAWGPGHLKTYLTLAARQGQDQLRMAGPYSMGHERFA